MWECCLKTFENNLKTRDNIYRDNWSPLVWAGPEIYCICRLAAIESKVRESKSSNCPPLAEWQMWGKSVLFRTTTHWTEVWYQSIGFTWKWLSEPFQITVSGKWLVVGYVWKMAFLVRWEIASTSQLFSENHLMRLFRLQICFLFSHTGRLQNVFLDSGCLRELRLNWL